MKSLVGVWPGLYCFHGCLYGLEYVMLLWFGLCDCLYLLLRYIYACFYVTIMTAFYLLTEHFVDASRLQKKRGFVVMCAILCAVG
jgi:hypothetical protein